MAIPFLQTLTRAARLFYPIAQRGVREGLSANRIIQSYLTGGGEIRRQVGLDLIRLVRAEGDAQAALRLASPRLKLRPEILPEALHATRRLLSYAFEVEARFAPLDPRDPRRGVSILRHVTVSTSRALTREEAEAAAESVASDKERYAEQEVTAVRLVRAVVAPGGKTI